MTLFRGGSYILAAMELPELPLRARKKDATRRALLVAANRRFHFALITPCRMHRLLNMFESAWNVTEPLQPMRYLPRPERDQLHADHTEMLDAFTARDAAALLASSGRHHQRLESVIAALPESAQDI